MYPANIKQVKTAQCSFLLFSTDLCIIFFFVQCIHAFICRNVKKQKYQT